MAANRFMQMETFVRIAKNQNFVAAAKDLALSPAMITRRLQQLEADLGVRLISRSTRRLNLTESGRIYLEFCTRAEFALIESAGIPKSSLI